MTRLSLVLAVLAAALLFSPPPAHAVEPDEVLADAALESRARNLSAGLRCVVCQNQSIDDSDAPLARDLRLLVRERLQAGDSDAAVLDAVVARYGEFVLLRPRFAGHTVVLWLLPLVLLVAAIFILWQRNRAVSAIQSVGRRSELSAEEEQQLSQLLEKRDGQTDVSDERSV